MTDPWPSEFARNSVARSSRVRVSTFEMKAQRRQCTRLPDWRTPSRARSFQDPAQHQFPRLGWSRPPRCARPDRHRSRLVGLVGVARGRVSGLARAAPSQQALIERRAAIGAGTQLADAEGRCRLQPAVGLLRADLRTLTAAAISIVSTPSSVLCISSMSLRACRCVSAVCLRSIDMKIRGGTAKFTDHISNGKRTQDAAAQ